MSTLTLRKWFSTQKTYSTGELCPFDDAEWYFHLSESNFQSVKPVWVKPVDGKDLKCVITEYNAITDDSDALNVDKLGNTDTAVVLAAYSDNAEGKEQSLGYLEFSFSLEEFEGKMWADFKLMSVYVKPGRRGRKVGYQLAFSAVRILAGFFEELNYENLLADIDELYVSADWVSSGGEAVTDFLIANLECLSDELKECGHRSFGAVSFDGGY
ncbi:hypothetical protein [Microbulbifer aggregans]|uniref:hypothetical protein n=1 Tax=Microbulbifer aggregans TaxID=1769779 RepID=UPI001CFF52FA|nr:hypothetical protein [Microbulbifer aggregans]